MKEKDQFLETMRARFREAREAEQEIRVAAKEDFRFVAGDQWDPDKLADRVRAGRPALVHNRLVSFVNQVTNEARQQRPEIRFSPVEDADDDTAEVYEGLGRHIQYSSKASVAYETAVDHQAAGSFGFFRLLTEYCDPQSFDQDLKVEAVMDPFGVYGVLIPAIRSRKCRYAFVVETLTREEYEATYGESEDFTSFALDDEDGWVSDREVRVAEYWYVETERRKLGQLPSGETVFTDEAPDGSTFLKIREVEIDTVHCAKTNGAEVLEEFESVNTSIPIFPVLGKSLIVDGKPQLFSLVRFMRDPQQLINYVKSRIAEALATSPISPWITAEGQLEGYEDEWATSNISLRPYLTYKPIPLGTSVAPPPQRQVYEPPIQALSQFLLQEIEELKAISGLYDAVVGDNPANQSGIAIQRQQQQGATTNMHFLDNLARAHEACGQAIAEAIPKLYDTPRTVRILGKDETKKVVKVNQMYADPDTGQPKHYQLSAGKYDITVTTGRRYSSKRIETFETLSQLVQAKPELMQLIGDIIFRNSDMAGAEEIADRLKKLLPPQLADDQNGQPDPQQLIGQLQQQGMMIEQLTGALNQLQQEQAAKKIEIDSRERIAMEQEKTKRAIALGDLNQTEGLAILEAELAAVKHRLDMDHQANMQSIDQQHQAEQAELGRQAAAEQAERDAQSQDGDEMREAA